MQLIPYYTRKVDDIFFIGNVISWTVGTSFLIAYLCSSHGERYQEKITETDSQREIRQDEQIGGLNKKIEELDRKYTEPQERR